MSGSDESARYAHCPVCKSGDMDGLHVDRCTKSKRHREAAVDHGRVADVPDVTTADLWAHLNSRTHNELISALVVQLALDLGWRPVVGSDPKRLWAPSAAPGIPPCGHCGAVTSCGKPDCDRARVMTPGPTP